MIEMTPEELNEAVDDAREANAHQEEMNELHSEIHRYREALEYIAQKMGPFSRDPLQHAHNCVEHMGMIAQAMLDGKYLHEVQDGFAE